MAKQVDTPSETQEAYPNRYSTFSHGRGWLYGLVSLLILVIVFIAGAAVGNHRHNVIGGMFGKRGFGLAGSRRSFGGGDFSSQNRLSGVVTSVNGNTFTLAGSGATNTVTTNSSTQYHGGSTVQQNDSVVAYGSTANGTFTATQVVINP